MFLKIDVTEDGHGYQAIAAERKAGVRRTKEGGLHSYPFEEIGFTPGSGHARVSSWWGMGILVLFISAMFIFGMMMFLESLKDGGESPLWGALWVVGMAAAFIPWSIKLARAEYRGKKLRGSPDPGNGNSISTTCPTTSSRESSNKGLDAHSDQDKGWLDFC